MVFVSVLLSHSDTPSRLHNEIRQRDRVLADKEEELRTLRSAIAVKDKTLEKTCLAKDELNNRCLKTEGLLAFLRTTHFSGFGPLSHPFSSPLSQKSPVRADFPLVVNSPQPHMRVS